MNAIHSSFPVLQFASRRANTPPIDPKIIEWDKQRKERKEIGDEEGRRLPLYHPDSIPYWEEPTEPDRAPAEPGSRFTIISV